MSTPIGDPRPAGEPGPVGDPRPAGEAGPAGDPRPAGHSSPDTQATAFDPSAHTVAEVQDYLGSATDDEHTRVLDAERAGKNRASLVG